MAGGQGQCLGLKFVNDKDKNPFKLANTACTLRLTDERDSRRLYYGNGLKLTRVFASSISSRTSSRTKSTADDEGKVVPKPSGDICVMVER